MVSTRSWSTTGWTLQCSKKQNEDQHWRTDLSETEMHIRPHDRESLRETDEVKYFRNTLRHHFIKELRMCSSGDSISSIDQEEEVEKWSSGSASFSLSLKCLRGLWMDNLPMSFMSEEQRQSQIFFETFAHVAVWYAMKHGNRDKHVTKRTRHTLRASASLERRRHQVCRAQEIGHRWNADQADIQQKLFPFCNNLVHWYFLSQVVWVKHRDKLTSSLSLVAVNVTSYTFWSSEENISGIFEIRRKSSMENPSLLVSGHVSSLNRTFIVEDYAEDEFGQWAKDEVIGEQGYVDEERSCFWTWDDTECVLQSRPFKGRQMKKKREKESTTVRSKRSGFLELTSRVEFEFRRCGFFFERFEFLVCSRFNHTQCGRTCACAVACLCPRNSITNVLVLVTIHDDTGANENTKRCSKKWNHCGRSCKSFVKFGFWWRKTNRTIRQLIPSAVSLRRAGVEQVYHVKRVIGGIGNMFVSVQCSESQSDEISN